MRTIVVTGSGSGIGAATTRLLRAAGHRVIGVDLRDADVIADLSTPEGRRAAVECIRRAANGPLNGYVACAGVGPGVGNDELLIRVNFFGAVEPILALHEDIACAEAPAVVVISSWAALRPMAWQPGVDACLAFDEAGALRAMREAPPWPDSRPSYATSKKALALWLRRAAPTAQWAGKGVTLNALAPGIVSTPMTAGMLANDLAREAFFREVPPVMPGVAQAEDVADIAAYLVGGGARRVSGQMIFVDGGLEAQRRPDEPLAALPAERWT